MCVCVCHLFVCMCVLFFFPHHKHTHTHTPAHYIWKEGKVITGRFWLAGTKLLFFFFFSLFRGRVAARFLENVCLSFDLQTSNMIHIEMIFYFFSHMFAKPSG